MSHRGRRRPGREGHHRLRIDLPAGGRYVGIPRTAVH
jgi:hypothetical protein